MKTRRRPFAILFVAALASTVAAGTHAKKGKAPKKLKNPVVDLEKFSPGIVISKPTAQEAARLAKVPPQSFKPAPLLASRNTVASNLKVDQTAVSAPVSLGPAPGLKGVFAATGASVTLFFMEALYVGHNGVMLGRPKPQASNRGARLHFRMGAKRGYQIQCSAASAVEGAELVLFGRNFKNTVTVPKGKGATITGYVQNTSTKMKSIAVGLEASADLAFGPTMCVVNEIALP